MHTKDTFCKFVRRFRLALKQRDIQSMTTWPTSEKRLTSSQRDELRRERALKKSFCGRERQFGYSYVTPEPQIRGEKKEFYQRLFLEPVLEIKRHCPAGQTRASKLFNPVWASFAVGPWRWVFSELFSFRIDFMVSSFDSPLRLRLLAPLESIRSRQLPASGFTYDIYAEFIFISLLDIEPSLYRFIIR